MNIQEKLETIAGYYETTRQAGHTQALMDGAKNTPEAIVLVNNFRMGDIVYKRGAKNRTASLNSLDLLRGAKSPLLIDNTAIYDILIQSLQEIRQLQQQVTIQESKLRRTREVLNY